MVESVDAYAARHGLVGRSDDQPRSVRSRNLSGSAISTRTPSLSIPATELRGRSAKCLRLFFKTNATVSKTSAADAAVEPAAAGISIRLQERIRDLEQTLRQERRALTEAEQRYEKLEEKYNALLRRSGPTA
jgi:hypothetical protein